MNTETKVCPFCNQEKSLDDFYFHYASGKHEKRCKQCKREKQQGYNQHPIKKSGVPHEQEIIDKLRSMGIYACAGKKSRSRWVDIVAFGCVAIEAKLGRLQRGNTYCFTLSKKQAEEGIRGDIVIFMLERGNEVLYHLIRSDNPVLYDREGNLKQWISYTPGSTHKTADSDTIKTMEQSRNQWGLILKVLNEKIQGMKQGKNIDKFADY